VQRDAQKAISNTRRGLQNYCSFNTMQHDAREKTLRGQGLAVARGSHASNGVEPKPKLRNEANPVLCFQQKRNAEANFDPSPRIIARGLLEAKKIAAMAEAYYVGVAPHNPLGPIANAAALHFALSTPNFLIQEDMLADVPLIPICSGDFSDCAPVAGWLRRVARIHPAQSGFWITGPHRDRACAGFVPRKSGPTAGGAVYAS
jgi:hypothetical protein